MENIWKISRFLLLLLFAGIIFGFLFSLLPPKDQITGLEQYLTGYFSDFMKDKGSNDVSIPSILLSDGKWILLFFILGISVVGSPFILLLVFIKGTMLGFTLSTLLLLFKEKGALFFLFSVLPQNLLILPIYICMGSMSLSVAYYLFQNRILSARGQLKPILIPYVLFTLFFFLLAAFVGWYEKSIAISFMEHSLSLMGF